MKFTVGTSDLQRILAKLGGVVPAKSPMPILETFLFDLVNTTLSITATDQMISSTMTLQVSGSEDGRIAIPAKRLSDTIRSLPVSDAIFTIDVQSNKIRIVTPNGEYVLTGESAKEYPLVPPFKGTGGVVLESAVLRKLIHRTSFAVSIDELRPAMMGMLLQAAGSEIRAVATDGHRLSRFVYTSKEPVKLSRDIIVPAKAMGILFKALETGSCTMSTSDTHVRFEFDQTILVSRLIEETYPNYESVIPADNTRVLTINRDDFIGSIRRVSLYANASTHQVRLDIGANAVKVSAQDVDFGGEAFETLPCLYSAEPLEIGFNANYLVDILSHLDGDQVLLRFSTPTRAGIVVPAETPATEESLMLIMPVRINT